MMINPNEGSDDHPDDEGDTNDPSPPSIHRSNRTSNPLQPIQQLNNNTVNNNNTTSTSTTSESIASKPHAFSGATLSPDHAYNLSTNLVLQLASSLSIQAQHSANTAGVLSSGERINIFNGSDLVDVLIGTSWNNTNNNSVGGGTSGGYNKGSVFRSASSSTIQAPGTPKSNQQLPLHILQLLQTGTASSNPNNVSGGSSRGGVPSTPGTVSTPGTSVSSHSNNTPTDQHHNQQNINPLSLLSTIEALESYSSYRTHYTTWITEAWNILKWSEPSAALFWEMATMFHTLYVASLTVRGGGSGAEVRNRVLGVNNTGVGSSSSVDGRSSGTIMKKHNQTSLIMTPTTTSSYIPPLLSCGSQSSMGSVRSDGPLSSVDGRNSNKAPDTPSSATSPSHPSSSSSTRNNNSGGAMKPARHSAKELPVWLISMFLLVHCEMEAFLRCTSGEDERRFSSSETPSSPTSGEGSSSLDFTALLHHKSLSPRTRLHAAGSHQNNANCASFLLSNLRKFILLCAVPRNVAACKAVATLAARGSGVENSRSNVHRYSGGGNNIDIKSIDQQHSVEHSTIGLDIELQESPRLLCFILCIRVLVIWVLRLNFICLLFGCLCKLHVLTEVNLISIHFHKLYVTRIFQIEELDRLHLVLQAPSGGSVDEPPVAIGEHILKILAMEEMESRQGKPANTPMSHRWNLMQNGLITVADAERILRRYLEEELTMAALDGDCDNTSDDVTSKLSKLSIGCGGHQPISPPRSRGVSIAESEHGKDDNYLKELSYQKLRSTTVLLEIGKDTNGGSGGGRASPTHSTANSTDGKSSVASGKSSVASTSSAHQSGKAQESGRLHDLHIADCSDTTFYLLQPFEHATIAACTDCTIVVGAVAGLLHVVDCERTTITSAARRLVVSNSFDVVHYLFTPSPPLLVGDNRGCQFAPYNTYYEGLREDLLATGLAAVLRSASGTSSSNGSVAGDTTASPGRGHQRSESPTSTLPTLQCASNKWKIPVQLCKIEVPQLPNIQTPGSPGNLDSSGSLSPGADDRALGGSVDVSMKTPVLLPSSEFDVLLVPVESEDARIRRRLLRESQQAEAAVLTSEEEKAVADKEDDEVGGESTTVHSTTSSLTGEHRESKAARVLPESDYCRILADLLTLSPFHMPHEYERRVITKAERVRGLQQAMQELSDEQRTSLQDEINRGFDDFLVTSGNLRQVLDLVHLEKGVDA